ncbi:hypothetical protein Krac_5324 [Ktedonobacter racemifer DSM 44963]|uniref:Uncharacterized protein n=1 Tax=Ktedonobacter racemifer DSM 44963 TaxID=485913 RepID=D6TVR5_KTERA|nr:hypothetical protein Krac_5324 [Ktedonobacter racemifer DSM 44963]
MAKQLVFDEDVRRMSKGVKISATMCWQIVMRICLQRTAQKAPFFLRRG